MRLLNLGAWKTLGTIMGEEGGMGKPSLRIFDSLKSWLESPSDYGTRTISELIEE